MLSLKLKHYFLRSVSQDNKSKSKNEQLGPIELTSFCTAKNIMKKTKT